MRHARFAFALLACTFAAQAADEQPEIRRPLGKPQAVGVLHSIRTIPEACTRVQGKFTGDAAQPYDVDIVKSGERCQPRALIVDAAEARPTAAAGWKLNDVARVPNAACPGQQAVLRVWRHPGNVAPPKLDAQGRSRVYLGDRMKAGQPGGLPKFALDLRIEGKGC
ncbi:hypothetical protein EBB59_12625 [Lysobacter pythonis]|uniref:Secreted protein n=1 Tax=Solilutibacter pythonis TaxID=2483112 RepID=A0A3M2HJF8_9GAMM|nr:hypothetical protein [Lysobacter pythonis]RMH87720.1 hypothetical protein EBB59_12625 [Lysobacter pythonis]